MSEKADLVARECTCYPGAAPVPCQRKFARSQCVASLSEAYLVMATERDNWRTNCERVQEHLRAISAERDRLKAALEKIADEEKIYTGYGDFVVEPALSANEAQEVAREALSPAIPTDKGNEG